jgi:FAD-NAD(P)-binding
VEPRAIAIVGLGPKGLYCLERLCAEFKARPLDEPLTVHVFERTARFGASPVYDPAQPDHILVNIAVGEIDLWDVDDPPPAAGRGPDFLSWHRDTFGVALTGEEFLPRSVVGRYLIDAFQRILEHLPPKLTVVRHAEEVTDIRPVPDGYGLQTGSGEIVAEKILLATGHSRLLPGPAESRYESFARRHPGLLFIPFAYPVVEAMRDVPAGARVAMLGIGLTFIDAVLELTEGRGGRFVREESLRYARSGREPAVIYPFSRTGLPMTPKAIDLPIEMRPLTFVKNLPRHEPLDFERDVLPLFELEMALQYYRVAGDRQALDACGGDAEAVRGAIAAWLAAHPEHEPFDYRRHLDPGGSGNDFIAQYMEEEIARAHRGQAGCGVKAAIDIWYEVRSAIGEVLPFGGLTPESHRVLVEHYFPRFKRIAFGPPVVNIEKLLALQKAGILDFSVSRDPSVVTDDDVGCFELRNEHATARAEVLVDARYPHVDLERDASPLYRNLARRGMIRAFRNHAYTPGAIDMTRGSRFAIRRDGTPNEDIAVIGIPTEGNLVGNLTIGRDAYAGRWAGEVLASLKVAKSQSPETSSGPA